MTKTTPSREVRDHHWSILPARCRATVWRTSYGRTGAISSAGLLVLSEPIARILVVGTEKAANGGKTGTSNFDGMLGSDTGHLELLQLAFGNTHVLRQQTGRLHRGVVKAPVCNFGLSESYLTDLYDRRPPNSSACSATKSRTLIAGRPVTRSTPSASRSYLPARFNAAIVTR